MLRRVLFVALIIANLSAQEPERESWLGSLAPVVRSIHQERGFPMDFQHKGKLTVDQWRQQGRAEVERCLSYWPAPVPLDTKVHTVDKRDGYEVRVISFAGSKHYRIPAYLLVPTTGKGPFPAVVALHDHGGWFVHGKEKLVHLDGEHPALKNFRDQYYGGRTWADDLARRGFVVIVPDAFYWGERRLQYQSPPKQLLSRLASLKPEQVEYVTEMNRFLREQAAVLQTWLTSPAPVGWAS